MKLDLATGISILKRRQAATRFPFGKAAFCPARQQTAKLQPHHPLTASLLLLDLHTKNRVAMARRTGSP
jgi:hypothetical protein